MNIFHDLQEITRRMDEKHSSNRKSISVSKLNLKPEKKLSYEERERQRKIEDRKSCAFVFLGFLGAFALLYLFIRCYIVIGDYIFNSSIFQIIAIIGFIGIVFYFLFLVGCFIFSSFAEAKKTGGISIVVLSAFFIIVAIIFTIMNRCT